MPRRANYRGRRLLFPLGVLPLAVAGLALAAGTTRWLVFLCGVGCLGLIDDLADGSARGLRGHGLAIARGEFSTGALKAAGTLALAGYAAAGDGSGGPAYVAEVLVLALAAHLGNLLDTRPGRTEKALGLTAAVICLASWSLSPLEPVAPLLPALALCAWLTLSERAMLGDTGASLIGGMIGVLLVTTLSPLGIALALAVLITISLYGESRSISAAIERVPPLQRLDSLGRSS
jgi:UDP-GlcNAc:undecaprenyl-phosphate/decaprenyl-phosphate GlcNAc-1-phosphate transferase